MPRVLVVDGDPAIREMAALALEKSGFAVVRAGSVEAARILGIERKTLARKLRQGDSGDKP